MEQWKEWAGLSYHGKKAKASTVFYKLTENYGDLVYGTAEIEKEVNRIHSERIAKEMDKDTRVLMLKLAYTKIGGSLNAPTAPIYECAFVSKIQDALHLTIQELENELKAVEVTNSGNTTTSYVTTTGTFNGPAAKPRKRWTWSKKARLAASKRMKAKFAQKRKLAKAGGKGK